MVLAKKELEIYLGKLNKIAPKTGKPVSELEERFMAKVKESKDKEVSAIWKEFLLELSDEVGPLHSNALPYYVYVFGDTGIYDELDRLKRIAIKRNSVDAEGTPLDYRDNVNGEPNPNYGMPLVTPMPRRIIYAIVSETPNFEKFEMAKLFAYDDLVNFTVNINKFYTARLIRKARPNTGEVYYNISKATRFTEYEPAITVKEFAYKLDYKDYDFAVSIAEENQPEWKQNIIAIKGLIKNISKKEGKTNKIINLLDEETFGSYVVMLPSRLPINFDVGAEVAFIGTMFTFLDGSPAMRAVGYIPII